METMVFDKVSLVNLESRPDRFADFFHALPYSWPFPKPERFFGIEGAVLPVPAWWQGGHGEWGRYRSHLNLVEQAIVTGLRSILILEDTARCVPEFQSMLPFYIHSLPEDAGLVYFAGEKHSESLPRSHRINDWCYRPEKLNQTYAYAILGRGMLESVYRHLVDLTQWKTHSIGSHLGTLHRQLGQGIYVPKIDLFVSASESGNPQPEIVSSLPKLAVAPNSFEIRQKAIVVLAYSHVGTNLLVEILRNLGVSFSDEGFEACVESEKLSQLCSAFFPDSQLTPEFSKSERIRLLRDWAFEKCNPQHQASESYFGAANPLLCLIADEIEEAWEQPVYVTLDTSSLIEGNGEKSGEFNSLDETETVLANAAHSFLARSTHNHIQVDLGSLLNAPEQQVQQIGERIGIQPDDKQVSDAVSAIQRWKQHIFL